jgi:hypothetical protein
MLATQSHRFISSKSRIENLQEESSVGAILSRQRTRISPREVTRPGRAAGAKADATARPARAQIFASIFSSEVYEMS